jgi:hypothetical protein
MDNLRLSGKPGIVVHICNPSILGSYGKRITKFEASLAYVVTPYFIQTKKEK